MSSIAADFPASRAEAEFRTCPVLHLKIDLAAERLIIANSVAAVVVLLIGGVLALLLALTRWQTIHLLDAEWFYRLLSAHGINMLIAWIVFFEMAGLYFGSTVLLNARQVAPKVGWFAFALMLAGGGLVNAVVLTGNADVMFTAYVPLPAHPLFYLSYILFAVGALIVVFLFFANLITAKREGTYEGSLPLVGYGLAVAAILAVYTILMGAAAMIPAFLWSIGIFEFYDPEIYRNLFWGFGHPAQQVNLAAMVAVWYALAGITVGAKPVNERLSRFAFVLYLFFINLGSAHHLLVDAGLTFPWKVLNTSYAIYLAVLGSMIHAFSIPAGVEVAQRIKGFGRGFFEWLRKAPWREPGFSALVVSMVLFGFIGGVTGVTIGTEQINMAGHNTMRVPGHFHSTVVAGTTLAFMGLTYYLIPLIFRRALRWTRVASWQPYVFGLGMALTSVGMIVSGLQGASRRHWDISFANAIFPADITGTVDISLAFMGIGAVIGTIGGAMFIAVVLWSLAGKKQEARRLTLVMSDENPLVERAGVTYEQMEDKKVQPKGTFIIVLAFLAFFVIYYFSNWWLLGRAWFVE